MLLCRVAVVGIADVGGVADGVIVDVASWVAVCCGCVIGVVVGVGVFASVGVCAVVVAGIAGIDDNDVCGSGGIAVVAVCGYDVVVVDNGTVVADVCGVGGVVGVGVSVGMWCRCGRSYRCVCVCGMYDGVCGDVDVVVAVGVAVVHGVNDGDVGSWLWLCVQCWCRISVCWY